VSRIELAETIRAIIDGVDVPEVTEMEVFEASVELPLEITVTEGPGRLRVMGAPPMTAMRTGFQPVIHRARFRVTREANVDVSRKPKAGDGNYGAAG
jgi:hypothetical protein